MRHKPQQTTLTKIPLALKYSWNGIKFLLKNELAFRMEVALCAALAPAIYLFEISKIEKLFLISSLFIILLMEMVNSAIEAVVDRISSEWHPLSKAAKDIGSCLVLVSFVYSALVWFIVLFS